MSYVKELNERKLTYRLRGWRELGNRCRCGHYWVNDKYPGQRFSIYEVARVIEKEDEDEGKESRNLQKEKIG